MNFTERGGWWVVAQVLILGLYVLALVGTEPVREGIALGFATAVGVALAVVGGVVGVWAFVEHRGIVSVFPAPPEGGVLVVSGPYRLVRHPIYFAVIAGTLGVALAALRPAAVVMALALVPFFMAKSGHEEEMLMARFPEYRRYRSTVPHRIIPWLL